MSAVRPRQEPPTGAQAPDGPPGLDGAGDRSEAAGPVGPGPVGPGSAPRPDGPSGRAGSQPPADGPADRLGLQGSLFDQADDTALGPLGDVRRTVLGDGAWIDVLPGWLSGADALFEQLAEQVPWRAERRRMYDNTVAVPRLLASYGEADPLPHPVLDEARAALTRHYRPELGEAFVTAGLCLYRDGRDSVAWHGDRIGRGARENTMVAILSVGTPRDLLLRPRGGRTSVRRQLGHGDLIVMGGSCQRTWEHAVPKSARVAGPRISIQFRPRGVR